MFGRTPEHAWVQPQYENPELIRPWGNVALEKTQKFVRNIGNGIRDNVNFAAREFQYIFEQINPFEASVGQVFEPKNTEETAAFASAEATASKAGEERDDEESLLALQEKLDDAAETIDVLDQKIADLLAKKNEKNNEIAGTLASAEATAGKEDSQNEEIQSELDEEPEDEENTQDVDNNNENSENNGKTALKQDEKLCEKSVDNQLTSRRIVINELAWMGNGESADDEWIELKNLTDAPVDLTGWQLIDKEKQIKIIFGGETPAPTGAGVKPMKTNLFIFPQLVIPASGFFLLERTNDNSVGGEKADLIYTGGLNNNDETISLFDSICQLQDEAAANPDWPAGQNDSKRTMERKQDLSWQTSQEPGGTPKRENSFGYTGIISGGIGREKPVSPTIFITEVQISAASSSSYDFIELYNSNDFSVDISNWQLKKKNLNGTESSIRVLPENSLMQARGYFIWMNSDYALLNEVAADATSSQNLAGNNSAALLDSEKNIIDQIAWGTSTDAFVENIAFPENPANGETLARKWSTTTENYIDADNNLSDFELQGPTPKAQNQTTENQQNSEFETPAMSVVINEIMWMGNNSQNSSDEWIELYNNTSSAIDLTGWKILKNGADFINLATTTISANGFYLLERTDSDTTNVSENQVYAGGLSNSGEKLELRNAGNTLIDLVEASSGWFSGATSEAYISMERIGAAASGTDPANWANNNLVFRNGKAANNSYINGTPASQNSVSKTETIVEALPFDEFDEITLTKLGNPYIIQTSSNELRVPQNKKLIIEPGVTMKFYVPDVYGPGDGNYLKVEGILEAVGEQNNEILFTSTGVSWPGIIFETDTAETNISSRLDYVKIEQARSWELNAYSAVKVIRKAVSIKNSTLENYYDLRGLYLLNSSSLVENNIFNNFNASSSNPGTQEMPSGIFADRGKPTIKNNTFNNNYQGVVLGTQETCFQNPDFKISGNNFNGVVIPIYITDTGFPCFEQNQIADSQRDNSGNIFNGILYQGGNMEQDNLWQSDLPIIIEKDFRVQNATLTVSSGIIAKFKSGVGNYLKIDSGGRLISQGMAESVVIFTSSAEIPASGNWKAIWFTEESSGELNYTKIKYGGYGTGVFRNECLVNESSNVVLNNVEKEFCEPYQ